MVETKKMFLHHCLEIKNQKIYIYQTNTFFILSKRILALSTIGYDDIIPIYLFIYYFLAVCILGNIWCCLGMLKLPNQYSGWLTNFQTKDSISQIPKSRRMRIFFLYRPAEKNMLTNYQVILFSRSLNITDCNLSVNSFWPRAVYSLATGQPSTRSFFLKLSVKFSTARTVYRKVNKWN